MSEPAPYRKKQERRKRALERLSFRNKPEHEGEFARNSYLRNKSHEMRALIASLSRHPVGDFPDDALNPNERGPAA